MVPVFVEAFISLSDQVANSNVAERPEMAGDQPLVRDAANGRKSTRPDPTRSFGLAHKFAIKRP
jgi:hypothetical protein